MRFVLLIFFSFISCHDVSKREEPFKSAVKLSEEKLQQENESKSVSGSKSTIQNSDIILHSSYRRKLNDFEPDSFVVSKEYLRSGHFYNFLSGPLDSAMSLYNKVSPAIEPKYKEVCASYAIWGNNLPLVEIIYSDLLSLGIDPKTSYLQDIIFGKKRFLVDQKCDSSTIKWIQENLVWPKTMFENNKIIISTIDNKNYYLLDYYLKNQIENIDEQVHFGLDGDADLGSYSPLQWALSKKDTIAAKILINQGAGYSKTELFEYADGVAVDYIYDKLISNGHRSEYLLDSSLFYPVMLGQIDKTFRLLRLGADPNQIHERYGNSPLFFTIDQYDFPSADPTSNKYEILKMLINHGADVDFKNNKGQTPIMFSTIPGCSDGCIFKVGFTKYLLSRGPDLTVVDSKGLNFWDYVIDQRNKPLMEYFIADSITPQKYQILYDSISKTIELDEQWTGIFDPEESGL